MIRLISLLSLLFLMGFANADEEPAFAIYLPATKDSPGAKFYKFEIALKERNQPDKIQGYVAPIPIFTEYGVKTLVDFWPERAIQPWPALKVTFTSDGFKSLKALTQGKDNIDFTIFVLGKATANITGAKLAEIIAEKSALVLLLPKATGELNAQIAKEYQTRIKK